MKKVLIISLNNDELYFRQFIKPILNSIPLSDYLIKYFLDLNPEDIKNYTHIIIPGTYLKDEYYLDHIYAFNWIKTFKGYLLGICAGSQIIASVFKSNIYNLRQINIISPQILEDDNILLNVDLNKCYNLHNLGFEKPNNFNILSSFDEYPRILKKDKIYMVTFHPEVYQRDLLKNFINLGD